MSPRPNDSASPGTLSELPGPSPTPPPARGAPKTYSAFGLTISSELELYGFEEAGPTGSPDIRVRLRSVPEEGHWDNGRVVRAYAPGTLHGALLTDGRDLDLEPVEGVDPKFLSAVVTGELFSVLLRQRGCLVLHGAVVERGGDAVGFVGSATWGKSTTAAALVARGWRLVSDDVLVVPDASSLLAGSSATVLPVAPAMRLAETSAAALGVETTGDRAHSQTAKLQVLRPQDFSRSAARLRGVFYLDPREAPAHEAVVMSAAESVIEATRHTRGRRLITSPEYQAAHLEQSAAVARAVPAWWLRRRPGLEHVGDLAALAERTAAAAATA